MSKQTYLYCLESSQQQMFNVFIMNNVIIACLLNLPEPFLRRRILLNILVLLDMLSFSIFTVLSLLPLLLSSKQRLCPVLKRL
jgi:hypothetical protein